MRNNDGNLVVYTYIIQLNLPFFNWQQNVVCLCGIWSSFCRLGVFDYFFSDSNKVKGLMGGVGSHTWFVEDGYFDILLPL